MNGHDKNIYIRGKIYTYIDVIENMIYGRNLYIYIYIYIHNTLNFYSYMYNNIIIIIIISSHFKHLAAQSECYG